MKDSRRTRKAAERAAEPPKPSSYAVKRAAEVARLASQKDTKTA